MIKKFKDLRNGDSFIMFNNVYRIVNGAVMNFFDSPVGMFVDPEQDILIVYCEKFPVKDMQPGQKINFKGNVYIMSDLPIKNKQAQFVSLENGKSVWEWMSNSVDRIFWR